MDWMAHLVFSGLLDSAFRQTGETSHAFSSASILWSHSLQNFEQFLGLIMWVTQLVPHMRTWLHHVYRDLNSIPASHYSVDPSCWDLIMQCIDDSLHFLRKPQGTAIPVGSQLLQARHQTVHSRSDLYQCILSDKRLWLRIRDPSSSRRKLSSDSVQVFRMFQSWLDHMPPVISMWPKPRWPGTCLADAFAAGSDCGIGGIICIIHFPDQNFLRFSLRMHASDFSALGIPMATDLQKNIACLETLAQLAVLFVIVRTQPGFKIPIQLPSLSDSTGADAVTNKLFTTSMPLALFTQKISLLSAYSGCDLDASHVQAIHNEVADALSRWDNIGPVPCGLDTSHRFQLSLPHLWQLEMHPRLFPESFHLRWRFPT